MAAFAGGGDEAKVEGVGVFGALGTTHALGATCALAAADAGGINCVFGWILMLMLMLML